MLKRKFSKILFYVKKAKKNDFIWFEFKISSWLGLFIVLTLFNYKINLRIPLYYKTN